MNSYSKIKLRISGIVVWTSIAVGLIGYWITNQYLYYEIGIVVIGLNFIVFGRDLAIYQVEKYKFNYWFVRIGYLVGGIIIVLAAILS